MKKTVLVIFGGRSSEYEVSLRSAASVISNIPRSDFDVITLGITKDGEWFLYEGETEYIFSGEWLTRGKITKAVISPDTSDRGIIVSENGISKIVGVDVVFPVLHGKNGEDGTIQGLLELSGIPFVGCDLLSSSMSMDKAVTNTIADYAKIRQAKWLAINTVKYANIKKEFISYASEYLGFPIFVKPANAGSSVGVSKVRNRDELENAIYKAFTHDRKVVLEQGISGREVECAVLGNDNPIASVVGEIIAAADFYDYDAKYVNDSKLCIPADITQKKSDEIRAAALEVYKALGCSGLSRADFFLGDDGLIYFNEINTIPGFTSISMYPKLFEQYGIPYPQLLERILNLAIEKWTK